MAQQLCRPWDPPTQQNTLARLQGRAVAQLLSESPEGGLLEMTGHWSHIDVAIDAPVDWLDVTTRLVRTIGGVDTVLEVRRVDAIPNMITSGGRVGGMLYAIRGRPGDRFRVEAWSTTVTHGEAKLYAYAWGEDGPVPGDSSGRAPVNLYNASPDKARSFTTGGAGLVATPTTIFTANPLPRSRVAVTEIVWTRPAGGAGASLLTLQETDGTVRAAWVAQAEAGVAGNGTYVRETWLAAPLYSAPGNGWQLARNTATATDYIVNVNGFNE